MLKKIGIVSAALVAVLIIVYVTIGFLLSNMVVSYGVQSKSEIAEEFTYSSPRDLGLDKLKSVSLKVAGHQQKALYRPLNAKTQQPCAAIIVHGKGSSSLSMLPYALLFNQRCALLLPDLRRHGGSGGDYTTFGLRESNDILKWQSWLQKKTNIKRKNTALFGESMGASTVLLATSKQSGWAFVVADSAYADLRSAIEDRGKEMFGGGARLFFPIVEFFSEMRAKFRVSRVNVAKAANEIETPVLLIHSQNDRFTRPEHTRIIYKQIKTAEKKLFMPDWPAKHARSFQRKPQAYFKQFKHFAQKHAPHFIANRSSWPKIMAEPYKEQSP